MNDLKTPGELMEWIAERINFVRSIENKSLIDKVELNCCDKTVFGRHYIKIFVYIHSKLILRAFPESQLTADEKISNRIHHFNYNDLNNQNFNIEHYSLDEIRTNYEWLGVLLREFIDAEVKIEIANFSKRDYCIGR